MLESSAGILQGFVEVALSPIKAAAKVRAKAHAARCHATSSARRLGALKVTAAIGRCGGPSQTIWVEVLRRRQDWALLYGKTRRYQRLHQEGHSRTKNWALLYGRTGRCQWVQGMPRASIPVQGPR